MVKEKINKDSDDVNDTAAYFGEVVRKKHDGKWICNLDKAFNSLYYGLPVITGLGVVKGVLLSLLTSSPENWMVVRLRIAGIQTL